MDKDRLRADELNRERAHSDDVQAQNRRLRETLENSKTVKLDGVRIKILEDALRGLIAAIQDATKDEAVPLALARAMEKAAKSLG